MILTGRTGLIAAACAVPVGLSPYPATTFVVLLALLAVAVFVDVVLAGSPRSLEFARSGTRSARLGQPVETNLRIVNRGRSRFRGVVRDAWAPSAAATPRTHPVDLSAGQQFSIITQLNPVRRGDQVPGPVTARSLGPLGLAGRQSSHRVEGGSASCRRSSRASTCRRGLPDFVNSTVRHRR